ncbi:MAG: universal stress protein [Pseudoxanthomonas sp.]
MKILLAVDDSEVGAAVVKQAAKLVKALNGNSTLYLLYVNPRLSRAAEKEFGAAGPGRYYDKQAEAALAKIRPLVKRAKLEVQELRAIGIPEQSIVDEAKAAKADLIIMGSHGKGALKSLLIGSVAQKVIASSKVPVLVVH